MNTIYRRKFDMWSLRPHMVPSPLINTVSNTSHFSDVINDRPRNSFPNGWRETVLLLFFFTESRIVYTVTETMNEKENRSFI